MRCHIVHLSAASALPTIRQTKQQGAPLTVETTHHYLFLSGDEVPDGATQYKCCPPIRLSANQVSKFNGWTRTAYDFVLSVIKCCSLVCAFTFFCNTNTPENEDTLIQRVESIFVWNPKWNTTNYHFPYWLIAARTLHNNVISTPRGAYKPGCL